MTKKQKLESELARLNEREEKLQLAKAKKEADLELANDEQDDFRVKISLSDYEMLKQFKMQQNMNPVYQQPQPPQPPAALFVNPIY